MNNPTYKAIPIEDYYVIVSDGKPMDHDLSFDSENKTVGKTERGYGRLNLNKIIAQSIEKHKGIALFDAPDEWKEDDVEKLAELQIRAISSQPVGSEKLYLERRGFLIGYNHHASTHPFTLEDIKKAMGIIAHHVRTNGYGGASVTHSLVRNLLPKVLSFIQQPKQRKEYEVELETEIYGNNALKIENNKIKILSWK